MKTPSVPARAIILAGALAILDFAYRSASGDAMTWLSAGLSVLSGILLALVFLWLIPRLVPSRRAVVAVLGFTLFIVEFAVNMVEGYFFSTVFPSIASFLVALPVAAAVAFLQAGLAVLILPARRSETPLPTALRTYVASRGIGKWIARWIVSAAAYLPVYLTFGAIVGPIVLPFYTNPQFRLVLPGGQTIVLVEALRATLYVLALFPLLAILRWDRRVAFLAVAGLVYIPGSFLPLVTRTWLPSPVIILQSLELLGDALVYAFIVSRLMAPGKPGIRVSGREPSPVSPMVPR